MKRTVILVGVVAVTAVAFGVWRMVERDRREWTSSSPQALAEFAAAMDARMKVYYDEAADHLQRALELDPEFVMARVMLWMVPGRDGSRTPEELAAMLARIDEDRLNDRERFLVRRFQAQVDNSPDEEERIVREYLVRHPEDPFALRIEGTRLWHAGRLEAAKRVFQRLVKIAPNWVVGYNSLGYIEMVQGDFGKSEEYFSTYRFIAPDQANPHDSLGELLMLTGRYDEAEGEVNEALEVRPDFCASYEHLVVTHLLGHRFDAAAADVERAGAQDACSELASSLDCAVRVVPLVVDHRWAEALEAARQGCWGEYGPDDRISVDVHRAAAFLGETGITEEIEGRVAESLEWVKNATSRRYIGAVLHHLRGTRAAAERRYGDAAGELAEADRGFDYEGSQHGLRKLFNRLCIAEVLAADGRDDKAAEVLHEVRSVNPAVADGYESGEWRPYGLEE